MSNKEFVFTVTAELAGIRLDKALSSHPEIDSRSQATSLIDRGCVLLNGQSVKPSHKTVLAEEFLVVVPIRTFTELTPYNFQLDIVHEDEDVIVINKPSGLVVHPAVGHRDDTLVNALLHHTNKLAKGFAEGRPGIVHRIDKETSGLIVVAKNDTALRSLANQFKNKTVHRIYWAVTYGPFKELSGTITSYIRRHPVERKKFASERLQEDQAPQGKLAITHYKVKKTHSSGLSLVNCQLETGRTHQIRVHLSEAGHPIIADPFYATRHRAKGIKSVQLRKKISEVPHLMLHAAELGFFHPRLKKQLSFAAPWPPELGDFLREIEFL